MGYRTGIAVGLCIATWAGSAGAQSSQPSASGSGQIMISCYRGPWTETIWDHPRAVFIDSLVAYGYAYPEASAIAYRLCRDVTLVGDDAALIAATGAVLAAQPPGSRR